MKQPIVIRLCVFVQRWEGRLLFAGACRDLSLFLNDSCAAGHLASVVSPVGGREEGGLLDHYWAAFAAEAQIPFLTDFFLNKSEKKPKRGLSAVVADLAASELHDSLGDSEQLRQEGKGGELGGGEGVRGD